MGKANKELNTIRTNFATHSIWMKLVISLISVNAIISAFVSGFAFIDGSWVIGILVLASVVLRVILIIGLLYKQRNVYYAGVAFLLASIVATIIDDFGFWDLIFLGVDIIAMTVLIREAGKIRVTR